jgi:hypothetical protein
VIHELKNRIVSYSVTYLDDGELSFVEVDDVSTYGNRDTPEGAAAAEIMVVGWNIQRDYSLWSCTFNIEQTPDHKFVLASNRLGPIFNITNPNHQNKTEIKSDSFATFKPTKSGKLEFVELAPSGGLHPRHFSLNKNGSMIAVANQVSGTVLVYARDVATGKIAEQIAATYGLGLGELT